LAAAFAGAGTFGAGSFGAGGVGGGRGFANLPPTPARPQVRSKLARLDSLNDTRLLVSTHLARCSSGTMTSPVEFQFQDHFDFIKQIGRSPTSEVWLVKSKASDTRYCVKKIIAKFNNLAERTRYIHEVEAVTFLPAHPNVVKYFRAWQENQQFYCQMVGPLCKLKCS
jgi:membrane-associated tyrosine/threonine-specific cdc2-inhibitory kinase